MINIIEAENHLILEYIVEDGNPNWVEEELRVKGKVNLLKTFYFTTQDRYFLTKNTAEANDIFLPQLELDEEGIYHFILGVEIDDEKFRINSNILGISQDLLISKKYGHKLKQYHFVAKYRRAVLPILDKLVKGQIVIGDASEGSIPFEEYDSLTKSFPIETELHHYIATRVYHAFKNYLNFKSDPQKKFNKYLESKLVPQSFEDKSIIYEFEVATFTLIRDKLREMLDKADSYKEKDWQRIMLEFLLIIFPKYVAVLNNLSIKDFYSNSSKPKNRYIDFTLVDANGNIDIIEIKQPFPNAVLSNNKYRDNYTPAKELTGSVMQAEKYIFHLSKWGILGEKSINSKRKSELPIGLQIKITNPKALIIMGRSHDFDKDKYFDFEIIKRKYSNMIDIITYDDLLARLDRIIEKFRKLS